MDHDAPEQETLNALETVTIVGVSLRRMGRAAAGCGAAFAAFGALSREIPVDDWGDEYIEPRTGPGG